MPALYLKQLQIAAAQQLDEQERDLARAASSPGADQLQQQLQQLRQWQYELSIAAAHHDRVAARWIADALSAADRDAQSDATGGRLP